VLWYAINLKTYGSYIKKPNGEEIHSDDPLWPPEDGGPWSIEKLRDRKEEIGTRQFARGFSNQPMSEEEQKIQPNWIRFWVDPPKDDWPLVLAMDLATSKKATADYTGVVIGAINPAVIEGRSVDTYEGTIKIVEAWHARLSFPDKVALVKGLYSRYKSSGFEVDRIVIETAAGGQELAEHLGSTSFLGRKLMGVKARHSKADRLDRNSPYLERGVVEFNPALDPMKGLVNDERGDLIGELLAFPVAAHDDLVDAFNHLIRYVTVYYEGISSGLQDEEDVDSQPGARVFIF
jgi:phage terminase large subunit-like protein